MAQRISGKHTGNGRHADCSPSTAVRVACRIGHDRLGRLAGTLVGLSVAVTVGCAAGGLPGAGAAAGGIGLAFAALVWLAGALSTLGGCDCSSSSGGESDDDTWTYCLDADVDSDVDTDADTDVDGDGGAPDASPDAGDASPDGGPSDAAPGEAARHPDPRAQALARLEESGTLPADIAARVRRLRQGRSG